MMIRALVGMVAAVALLGSAAGAQTAAPNPTQQSTVQPATTAAGTPLFRVTVVGRSIPAVNYRYRGDDTKIDLRGTPLLPDADGEAKIEGKKGYTEIEVEFDDLQPASRFGPEYLTYVLWAITPQGRATNLGEIVLDDDEGKLEVTTELQTFGLIVTAEPYFAVTQPSDVVVMENVLRDDTRGVTLEPVVAEYELLARGAYLMHSDPKQVPARERDDDEPFALAQARYAVHFARVAGADEYASEPFRKASDLLARAARGYEDDESERTVISLARQAVQSAEDARLVALQRREAELEARARTEVLEREAAARAAAVAAELRVRAEQREREEAEAERRDAEDRLEAERLAAEQRIADERRAAEARVEAAEAARAEAERKRASAEVERAEAEWARVHAEKTAAERAAGEADAEARARQAADAAEQAARAAEQAERERAALRERLQQQLNIILETRESARGLIVNMSDVLFDVDRATLKPGAREKLARVAGVLLAHPGLEIEVEGHTDSTGTDEYNQNLSERRAASVRDYLVSQGIRSADIEARGFGEARPVVGNDTAAGRQQNRRVELVISGESITTPTERR